MSGQDFFVYVHLTPTSHPNLICETLKLKLPSLESSLVNDVVTQVREYLTQSRNDGNKVYEVLAISTEFMGVPLPLGLAAGSIFTSGSDVYATIRVTVDVKRHIAPISSTPKPSVAAASSPAMNMASAAMPSTNEKLLKFRTITKYSYFESGDKWIKVLLPDLAGLSSHPADKIKVEFPNNRSFSVEVLDLNGQNWQFTVPRT